MTAPRAGRIKVGKHVKFQELGGETVILDLKNGKYFGLDEIGTRIWSLLIEHERIEPVFKELLGEFEVTEEKLEKDLLDLVDNLTAHGILQIDEA